MRSGRTGKARTTFRRRRQVGGLSDELEGGASIDLERLQVAGVDADHFRAERDRARQLVGVVRLDKRVHVQLIRDADQLD